MGIPCGYRERVRAIRYGSQQPPAKAGGLRLEL